ncbi:MAG TPA: hydrogenase nickel incorporation protein HypB [bacterium (Candidatus Stahlbacteria)]|nr:hydrogenase nickel incorporation protein HypB [Candidatus Stahlbacteria bacterium]
MKKIRINENILSANDLVAKENRSIFDRHKSLVLNIISSPGSGKTTLIGETITKLRKKKIMVIEGDIAGNIDARRLAKTGTNVLQINTDGSCHLDARMVRSALDYLPPGKIDLIFIENVGNLVCPAEFKVGEDHKIVLLSTTEGDDKPLKYPLVFQLASLLIINKIDLLPYTNFRIETATKLTRKINPRIDIVHLSCRTGEGITEWVTWITKRLNASH